MSDKIGDFIICPYCDYSHPDMCDYPEDIYSNYQEIDCDSCGKTFEVIGELSSTFSTYEKKKNMSTKEVKMKVYVVVEYDSYDKSTEVLSVQDSKEKAETRVRELKEEANHWEELSFKEFEVH